MKYLIEKVRFFASLLRNETMHNYDDLQEETVLDAMEFYNSRGLVKVSEDKAFLTI